MKKLIFTSFTILLLFLTPYFLRADHVDKVDLQKVEEERIYPRSITGPSRLDRVQDLGLEMRLPQETLSRTSDKVALSKYSAVPEVYINYDMLEMDVAYDYPDGRARVYMFNTYGYLVLQASIFTNGYVNSYDLWYLSPGRYTVLIINSNGEKFQGTFVYDRMSKY